ncbi:MAG: hypothetical protein RBT65_12285 [Methanolobus sp.]|nr:hypothetical protein [Methanolobus sp.]
MTHHMHKCYELKKGTKLYCKECGFEMEVTTECGPSCKEEGCCEVSELKCCGEPMQVKD